MTSPSSPLSPRCLHANDESADVIRRLIREISALESERQQLTESVFRLREAVRDLAAEVRRLHANERPR
jgi:hypothetical protein